MDVRTELLEVEEELWRAAGNRERYARNLAADGVHVFPGWGVADREAVLGGVGEAEPWKTFTIENPDVVILSDDSAALNYQTQAQRENEPPYNAAVTSVYRRHDGSWRLVVHQQTPLSSG
jgi:hypothetical protein